MKHAHLLKDPKLPKADYAPIETTLGDLTPDLTPGPRGRLRLIRALTQRFGENYGQFKAAKEALAHFDGESGFIRAWLRNKGVQDG